MRIDWGTVLRQLDEFYQKGEWRVPVLRERGADPYVVLVSTILSHRTRDEVTRRATMRLLTVYPSVLALAGAELESIESLVHEVGISKTKSRALQCIAQQIEKCHAGKVPLSETDLLELPMVGPKTAHAVRVFGYRKDGLPVDTHILRVARRMGAVKGTTIAAAQRELAVRVPRQFWAALNPALVQHGMNICRPAYPLCGPCPIAQSCKRVGVPRSRVLRTVN